MKEKKIETYGRRMNWRPVLRVVLFFCVLVVFVAILTVGKGFIFSGRVVDSPVEEDEKPSQGKVVIKNSKGSGLNFETISYDIGGLAKSKMVQDLPSNAVISLKIGNNYYKVSKGSVESGRASEPDISISVPASYGAKLGKGLCEVIREANKNGDLSFERHLSEMTLMWRYSGMLKYKGCLG